MVLTVGLFQLESLMVAAAPFQLLDIRVMPIAVNSNRVQSVLTMAKVVRSSDLLQYLKNFEIGKESPVILMCEDGRLSMSEALHLEKKGYNQVYVVEGGTDGLLRESDDFASGNNM